MTSRAAWILLATGCGAAGTTSHAAEDAGTDARQDSSNPGRDASPGPRDAGRGEVATDAPRDAAGPSSKVVAYASGYGPDIHWFSVDTASGALSSPGQIAAFGASPSFLAVSPDRTHLYAVDENTTGRVGAYAIDPAAGSLTFLDAVSSGGDGPPFVSVDATGKFVLVANYGDGSVSVLPVQPDGSLAAAVDTEAVGTEAHMILTDPSNHFAFVPCKGVDYVAQFLFDDKTGKLTPNASPRVATAAGAGPRHLAFHPDGRYAYLINETNSTMSLYGFDVVHGTLTEIQTVSTIPSTFTSLNTAAEVHVHPGGSWLFGSNRGDDSIVVFGLDSKTGRMTLSGFTPSGGTMPRDFTLDPSGTFLYAANQGTGNVVPFRFDDVAGTLTPVDAAVAVAMASYVGLAVLP